MTNTSSTIIWFKNDLRLHDNETLCEAIAFDQPILPVYIFDQRLYENINLGFKKSGYNRFKFLLQSVKNLRENLKIIGGELYVTYGIPEQILPKLVKEYDINKIYAEQEYAYEELEIIEKLRLNLGYNCELVLNWGKTLYHLQDIPFKIENIPTTSKAFRLKTADNAKVRAPFMAPDHIDIIDNFPNSSFPSISAILSMPEENTHPYVPGGETEALRRLHYYTFETKQLTSYRWTRNQSHGLDYSTKLSPYLAIGCISPRLIYQKIKQYEELVKKNQSTWWLVFELVWRDYFTFKGMQVGNKMFLSSGFKNKTKDWENDIFKFRKWCSGETGLPFIDAHMRQLNFTGFMSNRGRVNCASFLIYDYKINWTWGASYFESRLIDYDVTSNWMNWHYQAFEIWYTNPINQSLKYNAKEFIQTYIPELANLNDNSIYIPWELELVNYPKPIDILPKWVRSINKIKETIKANDSK